MRKTRQQQIRDVRDVALELSRKGSHAAALARFNELERLEPAEADWPRRAADCHRALGDVPQQIAALGRAAEQYAQAGIMTKAIAMCRMILALDPRHTETQERLAALQTQERTVIPPPRVPVVASKRVAARPAASLEPGLTVSAPAPRTEPERPRPELGRLLRQRYVELKKGPPAISGAPGAPSAGLKVATVSPKPAAVSPEPAFPFLPEGSLNEMVPGSKRMRGPRGIPSGMHRIEIGQVRPPKPAERAKQAAQKALPTTPLFSELGPQSLARLIARARLDHFEAGEAVYRQNDAAWTFHVVVSGTVAILAEQAHGERIELTRLGEGEFFGEAALVGNEPRPTTAEALEPTDVLSIARETIRELIVEEPRVLTTVLRFLRERLIESSMLTNPLFTILSGLERRRLAAQFEFLEIEPNSLVIWQGVRSPGLFVLLSGTAEVMCDDEGQDKLFATLGPGAVFGEMSLLAGGAAIADVRCVARSYALMLPKAAFAHVASEHPSVVEYLNLLAESRRRENGSWSPAELIEDTAPA